MACSVSYAEQSDVFPPYLGPCAPETLQQLDRCQAEIACLLSGMGRAIRSVKHLGIHVICLSSNSKEKYWTHGHKQQSYTLQTLQKEEGMLLKSANLDMDVLKFVSHRVCSTLAAAVPCLTELSLDGCCFDIAFDVFGKLCPQLVRLHVQAPYVPISALQDVPLQLPNLQTMVVVNPCTFPKRDLKALHTYMDGLLLAITHCTSLTSLEIHVAGHWQVKLKLASWKLLPASLQHLYYDSNVDSCFSNPYIPEFNHALRNISRLSLMALPGHCMTMLDLLQQFPNLNQVDLLCKHRIVTYDFYSEGDESGSQLVPLKQQLLDRNFQLDCHKLNLCGTMEQITDSLTWLPTFKTTHHVQLLCQDPVNTINLQHIQRVFPHLSSLYFGTKQMRENAAQPPSFIGPLSRSGAFSSMEELEQGAFLDVCLEQLCSFVAQTVRVRLCVCEFSEGGGQSDLLARGMQKVTSGELDKPRRYWWLRD